MYAGSHVVECLSVVKLKSWDGHNVLLLNATAISIVDEDDCEKQTERIRIAGMDLDVMLKVR